MQKRNIKLGIADISLIVQLFDAFNGSPKTGLTIANLQIRYIRNETNNNVTISSWQSLIALTALTDAHFDNHGYEIGDGYYRIDIPDAICATGINEVVIEVQDSVGALILVEAYQITPDLTEDIQTDVTTIREAINAHEPPKSIFGF
jgi:hypothetical protein